MTGNITIIHASYTVMCGDITFRLNFGTYATYKLTIGDGLRLAKEGEPLRRVDRDQVLELIRQGDEAAWTWLSFVAMWAGWAAGYEAAKTKGIANEKA